MTMSVPSTRSLPERIQWHRHWVVLLRAIGLPTTGILSLILTPLLTGGIDSLWTRGILILGSVILTLQAFKFPRTTPQIAQTPLTQRESVLHRVTQPVRVLMSTVALLLAFLGAVTVGVSFLLPTPALPLTVVFVIWLISIAFWLLLNTVDWRNDIYILTHDRIIDQVRFPLLYDQRTEARLDQVQNVRYQQGFWGGLLNFGDVTVETAGRTQAVLFHEVPGPTDIQRKIFERIDQLNDRRAGEEATRRQDQLTKWFRAYHTLAGRIEIISLPESVQFPRPIRVEWRVNTYPEQRYKTWIAYDTVPLAEGQDHAETDPFENTGRRRVHQIVPVTGRGDVYLKIWLRLFAPEGSEQPDEDLATRVLTVSVE
jgi:membrane protein YdbS with pleckstrin-like domain